MAQENEQSYRYMMRDRGETTGWSNDLDPNLKNGYNMLPAEVAIQAGNLSELRAITSHPDMKTPVTKAVGL